MFAVVAGKPPDRKSLAKARGFPGESWINRSERYECEAGVTD